MKKALIALLIIGVIYLGYLGFQHLEKNVNNSLQEIGPSINQIFFPN